MYHDINIGNLTLKGNIFLAPVAGYTDRAFRSICVDCGASFTYTELISSEAIVRGNTKTDSLMLRASNEKNYAVQLFGGNAEVVAKAAKIVVEKTNCNCIDINCGCPVPKVIKTGSGAFLTQFPEKLYEVVKETVSVLEGAVPVTVKIRSGWEDNMLTWKEAADAALSAGVSAITLHPRTRAQGYEGKANWSILKDLVLFINKRIPVFGSGDLFLPEDAKNMIDQTMCDAVMFARGAMGNPFIFTKTKSLLQNGTYSEISTKERVCAGFRELQMLISDIGEDAACKEMRKRFCAYTKGIQGGAELRGEIVKASTKSDYLNILKQFIS